MNIVSLMGDGTLLIAGIVMLLVFSSRARSIAAGPISSITGGVASVVLPALFYSTRWMQIIFNRIPLFNRLPALTERISQYIMSRADEINFDQRAKAEEYWPSDEYPELYQVVRHGLKRAPWDDGRLVGGYGMGLLINNLYTKELYQNALKTGQEAAIAIAFGFFVLTATTSILSVNYVDNHAPHSQEQVLEFWGDYKLTKEQDISDRVANAGHYVAVATKAIASQAFNLAMLAIASIFVFALAASLIIPAIVSNAINSISKMWRTPTKDALTRRRIRKCDTDMSRDTHRKALVVDKYIEESLGSSVINLGVATGTFSTRGAIGAPLKGDIATLDMESIFSHICVLGATGVGKSTAVAKPLFKQIASITNSSGNQFGALCLDAKGVLWRDLQRSAEGIGRGDDIVLIGVDAGMRGLDPLAHLKSEDLASAIRSVMDITGDSKDSYWRDLAEILITHVAALAYAMSRLIRADGTSNHKYYSLMSIYYLMGNEKALSAALEPFLKNPPVQEFFDDNYDQLGQLKSAIDYLSGEWAQLAQVTKSGILSNASAIFNPIYANPNLARKFSAENDNVESIERIFDGKLFMLSISAIEFNTAAKLLQVLIKTAFYRAASIREIKIGATECQKKPVMVMIDEAQDIVSTGSLGDSTFYNRARSTGVCGILISQGLSAYYQAIGREAATNMLQQLRTKLIMHIEDMETHEFVIKLAGDARRAMSYQVNTAESLEYLYNAKNYYFTDYSKAVDAAEAAKNIVMRFDVKTAHETEEIDRLFKADYRFYRRNTLGVGGQVDNGTYERDAHWRAEDKHREYLAEGNELTPILSTTDILSWGRYNMFAYYHRAGISRMDVIVTEHDYS
jgi:hypothetical protein